MCGVYHSFTDVLSPKWNLLSFCSIYMKKEEFSIWKNAPTTKDKIAPINDIANMSSFHTPTVFFAKVRTKNWFCKKHKKWRHKRGHFCKKGCRQNHIVWPCEGFLYIVHHLQIRSGQSLPNKSTVSPWDFARKPRKKPSAVAWLQQAVVQNSEDLVRASKTEPSSFFEEGIFPLYTAGHFPVKGFYPNASVCTLQIAVKTPRSIKTAHQRDTEFIHSHMEIFIYMILV